jgi:hypothetical protein
MSIVNLKKILLDINKQKLSLDDIFKDIDDQTTCNEIFFRNAVQLNGNVLKYASDNIRDNKEIVMIAVKETCFALLHASERLKNDEDIVLESTRARSDLYDNHLVFPETFLKNRDFVLKLIQSKSYNIEFIPIDLKDDKLLYFSALSGDSSILVRIKAFDDNTYNKLYILLENKEFAIRRKV